MKFDFHFKKPGKKALLIAAAVFSVCAIGGGVWYYLGHNSSEPVYVYPFSYVGMTEYWGDSMESHGPVSTDNIQTVFVSDTQTVTKIHVKEGDMVKKGDVLMTFDTTLSDLALEKKRLEVEKLKLDVEEAKKELRRIKGMRPMQVRPPEEQAPPPETEVDYGYPLEGGYKISPDKKYDGSSPEKALICWVAADTPLDDTLLNVLWITAQEYQNANLRRLGISTEETSAEGGEAKPEAEEMTSFYVVFRITQDNMSLGERVVWQGMKVKKHENGTFTFNLTDASAVPDHMFPNVGNVGGGMGEVPSVPDVDMGSGYTAQQLLEMRKDQERKIRDLGFQLKTAEADYKIKQKEMSDGSVRAELDGKVVSLLKVQEAMEQKQPVMKISGGGGFLVEGSVGELSKEILQVGQEVTVNDWRTGMSYTGKVQSIGDFPSNGDGSWSSNNNPNVSYYPFVVFVDESADLQAGTFVNIMYSVGGSQNGIYLENPFLRTENGRSYVMVQGANGKLEKRFVKTGKALWGSYMEILSGITADDKIAFPYGKNVKAGAKAIEGDIAELYG